MKKCQTCGRTFAGDLDRCPADGQSLADVVLPPPVPGGVAPPVLGSSAASLPPVVDPSTELEQRVWNGGRFVIFHYCISVIVLTFRRTSEIIYLAPGEDGAKPALTNSLLSFFAGWWGFPWGPIWTIVALAKNASGGTEVTQAVLAAQSNPARAAQIMNRRRVVLPRGHGLRNLRIGMVGAIVLIPLLLLSPILIGAIADRSSRSRAMSSPGFARFSRGNALINHHQGSDGLGNSPQAVIVAEEFTKLIKQRRNTMFAAAQPRRISAGTADFISCCELYDSQCAIIVNVPDLRQFDSEAKVALGEIAWSCAQEVLREQKVASPGMKLAVGVRGVLLYDRVLIGNVTTNTVAAGTSPTETVTDSHPEQRLYPFFEPPEQSTPATGSQPAGQTPSVGPQNQQFLQRSIKPS